MITIAKRNSSLLIRLAAGGQVGPAPSSLGFRATHHNSRDASRSAASAETTTATIPPARSTSTSATASTRWTSSSERGCILPEISFLSLTPLPSMRSGAVRYFGRKGSRMGHDAETLNELAHADSREEAKHRREEKKKKSKKARLSAHKESGNDSSEAAEEVEDDVSGGGENDDLGAREDEFGNPLLPDTAAVRSKMFMVVASLERSFAAIRGGEATPEMFDSVRVSAYGETVPLGSVGQVVIEDPRRATISCYDPSVSNDVRDAVRDMPGMSLNPYVEEGGSGVVVVPIPRASEETRKEMAKELGRQAEHGKQRVRNIRRKAMDIIGKGKQGKLEGISKDDAFRTGKEVDAVTEEALAALKDIVERKQRSVMED